MKPFILFTISAFILSVALSCKKSLPNAGGNRLDQIVNVSANNSYSSDTNSYQYNPANKLVAINEANGNGNNGTRYTFQYDQQNNLIKASFFVAAVTFVSDFVYDNNGNIIKANAEAVPGYSVNDYVYTYDNSGRVITDTAYFSQTNQALYYYVYQYDNNDNIIQFEQFVNDISVIAYGGRSFTSQGKVYWKYDNNPNPLYRYRDAMFFSINDARYLSKNNIITESYETITTNQITQYDYYSNGLPRKSLVRNNPNDPILEYFYK